MNIRKATISDIDSIMSIFDDAVKFIASYGSDQWQNATSPDKDCITTDIKKDYAYVLIDLDKVVGYMCLSFDLEKSYSTIKNGRWESDYEYSTIHRLALLSDYRGKKLSKLLFDFAEKETISKNIRSIRIDTHELNAPVKSILRSRKYKRCGIITIENDETRIAYEKLVIPFAVGDNIQLKKSHPCGSDTFTILRIGMDLRLQCNNCKSQIWLPRNDVSKRVKKRL